MSKDYLIALGGGAASALASFAFLSGMGGALVFAYLSLFPIFAVGFGWGVRHGYIALLFGLFLAFALGGLMAGGVYALATTVPGAIIIRQAVLGKRLDNGDIYWYPLGHILCTLAAAGAAAIALLALANLNADDGFQGMLAGFLDQVLQARFGASQRFDTAALSASLIPLLPAAIVSSWLLFVPFASVSVGALFIWGRLRIESWFQRSNAKRNTAIAEETIKRLLTLDLSPSAKKEVIDQQHRLVTTQAKQAVDLAITPKE